MPPVPAGSAGSLGSGTDWKLFASLREAWLLTAPPFGALSDGPSALALAPKPARTYPRISGFGCATDVRRIAERAPARAVRFGAGRARNDRDLSAHVCQSDSSIFL